MHLRLKILHPSVRPYYNQALQEQEELTSIPYPPKYKDSGFDLYCPQEITVCAGETVRVGLGIAAEAIYREKPTAYYIYPRSSICKTPLRLANSVGIIDSGYRGELILALDNIKDKSYTIKRGQRLAQICGPHLESIEFELVAHLSETDRGSGGFGSTGT